MADAKKRTLTPEESRQLAMDEILIQTPWELAGTREICAAGAVGKLKQNIEAKHGAGSFPAGDRYCTAVIRQAISENLGAGLYLNLGVQQLGRGTYFTDTTDAKAMIDGQPYKRDHNESYASRSAAERSYAANATLADDARDTAWARIARNVRAAALADKTDYVDAAGKSRLYSCGLALDAGAALAAANPGQKPPAVFTEAQVKRMTEVCYDPSFKDVTINSTGERMTVQKMGYLVGSILGKQQIAELPATTQATGSGPATDAASKKRATPARN